MRYEVCFDIATALYMLVVLLGYLRYRRQNTLQNRLYGAMVGCGFGACLMDVASALLDVYSVAAPRPLVWAVNMLLMDLYVLLPWLMFHYVRTLAGQNIFSRRWHRYLCLLPPAALLLMVASSPWTGWIVYLDALNRYYRGTYYPLLILVGGACTLGAIGYVAYWRRRMAAYQWRVLLVAGVLCCAAIAIQVHYPRYLLINTGVGLSYLLILLSMQGDRNDVDPVTGGLTRRAMLDSMRDLQVKGRPCQLAVYMLENLESINLVFGPGFCDRMMYHMAGYLSSQYHHRQVARIGGGRLTVLLSEPEAGLEEVRQRLQGFPSVWRVEGRQVRVDACRLLLNAGDFESLQEMIQMVDHACDWLVPEAGGGINVVGAAQIERFRHWRRVEAAVERAIEQNRVDVRYQPVFHLSDRAVCALDARACIHDAELGELSAEQIRQVSERSGSFERVGALLLERVCALIADYDLPAAGIDHVVVPLSAGQCMQRDLCQRVSQLVKQYGIPPRRLAFEVDMDAAAAQGALAYNMQHMTAAGHTFQLSDSRGGNTGIARFLRMPFARFAMCHLPRDVSEENAAEWAFVRHLSALFRETGICVVCAPIVAQQQLDMARQLGIEFGQGDFLSVYLSRQELTGFLQLSPLHPRYGWQEEQPLG